MSNGRPTVLIVDDDELNLDLISEYIRETEIGPVPVANGEQALGMLHENPDRFSAVLLDRMLSDIDGLPRPLHLWRNFSQWLGGMGIIVLAVAVLLDAGLLAAQPPSQPVAPGPVLVVMGGIWSCCPTWSRLGLSIWLTWTSWSGAAGHYRCRSQ